MKTRAPRSLMWFYILVTYVVVQFAWWAYHLISLSNQVYTDTKADKRFWMIMGEGMVFFVLLIVGVWQLKKSVKREMEVNTEQRNFLLSTTHELKTPLSVVKLYLQTLRKRELPRDQQLEMIDKAVAENERLTTMINRMLLATRLESGVSPVQMNHGNLSQLMREVMDTIIERFPAQPFEVRIDTDIQAAFDPEAMRSIITNLVENAVKYNREDRPAVSVELIEKGGGAVLVVMDRGRGIKDKEAVKRLFVREENEETRSAQGSGLGLYIVDQMCKLQGATLLISDRPEGEGTIVTVDIGV